MWRPSSTIGILKAVQLRRSAVLGAVLAGLAISGCQLPERVPMPAIDQAPALDAKSFIAANNGVLPVDLAKLPGAICVPNVQEVCDADHTYPMQFLKDGAKIVVAPGADPAPAYDGLIDAKYKVSPSYPFVSPAQNPERVDEIKAYIVARATIAPGTDDGGANGFPGAAAIVAGLQKTYNVTLKAGGVIYWITEADLVSVTNDEYSEVPDMYEVIGTGFGGADATYNSGNPTRHSVWLGIQAVKIGIVLGTVPASPGAAGTPATALMASAPAPLRTQIFDVDNSGKIRNSRGLVK
jgi:hypothetical protein